MNQAQFSHLLPEDQARYMRSVLAVPGASARVEAQTRAWTDKAQAKGLNARLDEQAAAELAFWAEAARQDQAQLKADKSGPGRGPVSKSSAKISGSAKRAGRSITGPGPSNGPKIDYHVELMWLSVPGSPLSHPERPWAHTCLPETKANPYLAQFRAKVRGIA